MRTALILVLMLPTVVAAEDSRTTTVGMPGHIKGLLLPGSELEAKPITDRQAPVVLRVVNVFKHGTDHRYDLEYYGLEKGKYDLRAYLRRKDGTAMDNVPSLPILVESELPAGQVVPHELGASGTPWLGGYTLLLIVGGILWVLGAGAILFVGRKKKGGTATTAAPPRSVADRLRPLVERALSGELPPTQLAELERTLLAFWRRRLGLEDERPVVAMSQMRNHPEAGPLLAQLEIWLHRPGPPASVDINTLLRPYQTMPQEMLDGPIPEEAAHS